MTCQTLHDTLLGALLAEPRTSFLPLRNFSVSQPPASDPMVHENCRMGAQEPGVNRWSYHQWAEWK